MNDTAQIYLSIAIVVSAIVVYLVFACMPPVRDIKESFSRFKDRLGRSSHGGGLSRNDYNKIVTLLLQKNPNISRDRAMSLLTEAVENYKQTNKRNVSSIQEAITVVDNYISSKRIVK